MKKIIIPIFIVIIALLLVSCEDKDEVAGEIVEYYNEEWVPMNEMKQKRMGDIPFELTRLEEENKENEAAVSVEDEILPIIDNSLERLEAVNTDNKKVKKMNDLQIEAEEFAKEMTKEITVYYEGGDVTEQDIEKYHRELDEKYDKFLDYRDELMDQYNLKQIENENSSFNKLKREEE